MEETKNTLVFGERNEKLRRIVSGEGLRLVMRAVRRRVRLVSLVQMEVVREGEETRNFYIYSRVLEEEEVEGKKWETRRMWKVMYFVNFLPE